MLLNSASSRPGSARRCIVLGEIVAVLLAFIMLTQGWRAAPALTVAPIASPVPVEVWMTTTSDPAGRTVVKKLEPQAVVTFTDFVSPTDGRPMIWASETITYQQIVGFGGRSPIPPPGYSTTKSSPRRSGR